ncbi:hypothetical protein L1049_000460 [Liquidambar formosana]|uniref:Uncharacterized protein n=1 Tax=Liquidambar formosana TaxID=63359 RepID=A0AAP0NBH8_LIQFO
MASDNEPAKLLLPYLQRADELQKHEPLVAYYCRLYAMERGLRIPQSERTKTTNSILDKKSLKLGPEDNLYLEGFASNVFAKADKQDRAGRADLNTAKTFYAASIFFEILNQFGELQPDLEQKQKYAAWKAVDIRKALKEGRKPEPGPPAGDKDLSILSSTPSGSYDLGPSETGSVINPEPGPDPSPQFHDQVNHQHSSNIPPPSSSYPPSNYPSHDFHPPPPPPTDRSENSTYSQPYHQPYPQEPQQHVPYPQEPQKHVPYSQEPQQHVPYPQEPQTHVPQNYPSHETSSSYSYPNFQSYPSFSESSLPAAPSHYPSYYQGADASYTPQSAPPATAPPATNYASTAQYNSSSRNGTISEPQPTPPPTYQYDSNYQPPPEKIAEAHKAARFAVGALAFDDVSVAVDFLKKSLELLTNPSAGQ